MGMRESAASGGELDVIERRCLLFGATGEFVPHTVTGVLAESRARITAAD